MVEYHRGFLTLDLVPQATRLSDRDRLELGRVARRAWWAAERNLVHLVQRRLGPGAFAYLVVIRPKPRHAAISLSSLLRAETA